MQRDSPVGGERLVDHQAAELVSEHDTGPGGNHHRRDDAFLEADEHDTQQLRAVELVVAVGDEHQGTEPLDTAADQPQDIERRLIGPVDILEHQDGR